MRNKITTCIGFKDLSSLWSRWTIMISFLLLKLNRQMTTFQTNWEQSIKGSALQFKDCTMLDTIGVCPIVSRISFG